MKTCIFEREKTVNSFNFDVKITYIEEEAFSLLALYRWFMVVRLYFLFDLE